MARLTLLFLISCVSITSARIRVGSARIGVGKGACTAAFKGCGENKCTEEDQKKINEKGGGTKDGSWPAIQNKCGRHAYSFGWGFYPDKSNKFLVDAVGISQGCAQCFTHAIGYGVGNCKMACMRNWKSADCLNCGDGVEPACKTEGVTIGKLLAKCTGFESPKPE